MVCVSKLDRQLKDIEEILKYILIIRKIRRRRFFRDKKPRRTWVRKIYNNRSAYGDFSTLFQGLHTDLLIVFTSFFIMIMKDVFVKSSILSRFKNMRENTLANIDWKSKYLWQLI